MFSAGGEIFVPNLPTVGLVWGCEHWLFTGICIQNHFNYINLFRVYIMISSAEQNIHVWMLFGFRSCVVCWCLDRGASTTQPTPTGSPSVCVSCSVPSHSLVLLPCIRVSNSVCVWHKVHALSSSNIALFKGK